VAWGVDDIDLRSLVRDRSVLGIDGDAALLFELIAVHGDTRLTHPRLLKDCVGKGCLPMVDVGNNGNVADFHKKKGGEPLLPGL
jgi:hypothetical protein